MSARLGFIADAAAVIGWSELAAAPRRKSLPGRDRSIRVVDSNVTDTDNLDVLIAT